LDGDRAPGALRDPYWRHRRCLRRRCLVRPQRPPYIADLSAGVGSIIFGAAIALTGQMYHLGDDFAGGMLLFATGLARGCRVAGSRGALAVALVAACVWNHMRVMEFDAVHLSFVAFWAIGALLRSLGTHRLRAIWSRSPPSRGSSAPASRSTDPVTPSRSLR